MKDPLLRCRKAPLGIRSRRLIPAQQEKHEATGYRAEESTKLVPRIKNWKYEDHLAVLNLTSLNERRA